MEIHFAKPSSRVKSIIQPMLAGNWTESAPNASYDMNYRYLLNNNHVYKHVEKTVIKRAKCICRQFVRRSFENPF